DAKYLCRALAAAELALHTATFTTKQERLSWEELRRDDLTRLREDAAENERANCRYDASGKPSPPRVAMLTDADAPAPEDAEATTTVVVSTSAATPGPVLVASTTDPGERQAAGFSPAQVRH